MVRAEQHRHARASRRAPRRGARRGALAAACAALALAVVLAACDDNRDQSKSGTANDQAQTRPALPPGSATPNAPSPPRAAPAQPPSTAPGARPSAARIVGTWTVTEAKGGPGDPTAKGDKVEGTTYRFEDGGKVTVAGAKRCTYTLQPAALEVKCDGATIAGAIELSDHDETIVWTVGKDETITLRKR